MTHRSCQLVVGDIPVQAVEAGIQLLNSDTRLVEQGSRDGWPACGLKLPRLELPHDLLALALLLRLLLALPKQHHWSETETA